MMNTAAAMLRGIPRAVKVLPVSFFCAWKIFCKHTHMQQAARGARQTVSAVEHKCGAKRGEGQFCESSCGWQSVRCKAWAKEGWVVRAGGIAPMEREKPNLLLFDGVGDHGDRGNVKRL